MEDRKAATTIVRDSLMFVLKKKVLEPDLTRIDAKSV